MSTPVQKPAYVGGTNASSGSVQTGQLTLVRGGGRSFSQFSGALITNSALSGGGEIMIYSGAGRLDSCIMHNQLSSGLVATFYDAAIATSGGPFPLSGHKILFVTPPTWAGGTASTSGSALAFNPNAVLIGQPFQSGLVVNIRSGNPGWTIDFSPEVSQVFPGAN